MFDKPIEHQCESYRKGDWIIYHCPLCPDYKHRVNWRTGESEINHARADVNHSGKFVPDEFNLPSGYLH